MPERFDLTFANRLIGRLSELGLTQYRLAKRTGLSTSYIGNLAQGRRLPTGSTILRIAPVLEVPADELAAWSDESRLGVERIRRIGALHAQDSSDVLPLAEGILDICNDVLLSGLVRIRESLERMVAILEIRGVALWATRDSDIEDGTHNKGPFVFAGLSDAYLDLGKNRMLVFDERCDPPIIRCLRSGQTIVVNSEGLKNEVILRDAAAMEGYNGLFVCPIKTPSGLAGVASWYLKDGHRLNGRHVEKLVEHFSNVVGVHL